jgi:5'-nucleotidase
LSNLRWDLIFFDLDNTLYSHEDTFEKAIGSCYKYLTESWKKRNINFNPVSFDQWFIVFKSNCDKYWALYEEKKLKRSEYRNIRYRKTMEYFKLPYKKEEEASFHQMYNDTVHLFCQLYEGVEDCLHLLIKNGVTTGIITNGSREIQMKKLKSLEVLQFLPRHTIYICEEGGIAKPNKHIFDMVRENCQGQRALYVGDSWDLDVTGALHAGWDVLYLNSRAESTVKKDLNKVVSVCKNFHEVAAFLEKNVLGK